MQSVEEIEQFKSFWKPYLQYKNSIVTASYCGDSLCSAAVGKLSRAEGKIGKAKLNTILDWNNI